MTGFVFIHIIDYSKCYGTDDYPLIRYIIRFMQIINTIGYTFKRILPFSHWTPNFKTVCFIRQKPIITTSQTFCQNHRHQYQSDVIIGPKQAATLLISCQKKLYVIKFMTMKQSTEIRLSLISTTMKPLNLNSLESKYILYLSIALKDIAKYFIPKRLILRLYNDV